MIIPDFTISKFYGLNTNIKDLKTLKPGVTPDSINWITGGKEGDHIELRRGQALLGQTRNTDIAGKVTGLGVGIRYDGVEVPFFSHTRKVKYYDSVTDDTIEVGSNLLPAGASGEDVWVQAYQNLAGSFVYLGSPNSGVYKIPVANPGSAVDQAVNNYRWGVFHVGQNRVFAGQRNGTVAGNQDKTGLYLSYIDKALLSSYTQITGEVYGTGDGVTLIFAHTATNAGSSRTLMYPSIYAPIDAGKTTTAITQAADAQVTANAHGLVVGDFVVLSGVVGMTQINNVIATVISVIDANNVTIDTDSTAFTAYSSGGKIYKAERFVDDKNGNLISNLGGTGTINYATGAMSVTFNTAPTNTQQITTSYYYELSSSTGILDFTGSGNGQGKSFRQDNGAGNLMAIFNLNTIEYCFHLLKTWQFQGSLDDTDSTNLEYRNVGIPYPRAAFQAPEGIIFSDLSRPNDPKFRRLEVLQGTNNNTIEPLSISDVLDLSPYDFDYCVAFRWGDFDIFSVQEKLNGSSNTYNSKTFVRNVLSKAWDLLDYYISCPAEYNGTLIAGDSISNNVLTLFSGWDDDGDVINNYWTSSDLDLKYEGLKNCRRMVIDGLIQPNQSFDVSLSFDGGAFTKVYTILGNGSYVDTGIDTYIGGTVLGSKVLGGGGGEVAHPFEIDFPINTDKFIYVRIKIEALGIGYVSVNSYTFKDIRDKGRKNIPARTI
jgi:hypothetical protein